MFSPRYALVAYVRDAVGEFVEQLRRELHPAIAHMAAHLTVLPPRDLTGSEAAALEFLEEACSRVVPFSVELGEVETFLPTTPTVFIQVKREAFRIRALRRELALRSTSDDSENRDGCGGERGADRGAAALGAVLGKTPGAGGRVDVRPRDRRLLAGRSAGGVGTRPIVDQDVIRENLANRHFRRFAEFADPRNTHSTIPHENPQLAGSFADRMVMYFSPVAKPVGRITIVATG